jgi:hypothetical protein
MLNSENTEMEVNILRENSAFKSLWSHNQYVALLHFPCLLWALALRTLLSCPFAAASEQARVKQQETSNTFTRPGRMLMLPPRRPAVDCRFHVIMSYSVLPPQAILFVGPIQCGLHFYTLFFHLDVLLRFAHARNNTRLCRYERMRMRMRMYLSEIVSMLRYYLLIRSTVHEILM